MRAGLACFAPVGVLVCAGLKRPTQAPEMIPGAGGTGKHRGERGTEWRMKRWE
jgi:hypothetical protein